MKLLHTAFPVLIAVACPLSAAEYFVDAIHGDDSSNGLSPEAAWRSLEKVNGTTLAAGDVVRFRSGQVFPGQLRV